MKHNDDTPQIVDKDANMVLEKSTEYKNNKTRHAGTVMIPGTCMFFFFFALKDKRNDVFFLFRKALGKIRGPIHQEIRREHRIFPTMIIFYNGHPYTYC